MSFGELPNLWPYCHKLQQQPARTRASASKQDLFGRPENASPFYEPGCIFKHPGFCALRSVVPTRCLIKEKAKVRAADLGLRDSVATSGSPGLRKGPSS